MSQPLTIHIMTSSLAPGDAIGNYILTKARILRSWGVKVRLYADFVDPEYPAWALASDLYRPTGNDILWYHYSIYADNLAIVRESPDYKIMDFHGISPPRLFHNQNPYLEMLCQKGIDLLPSFADVFDVHVVHSDYARRELVSNGYADERIYKVPLCVDLARFSTDEVAEDDPLKRSLSQVEYLLFVGRVVPQKDILALLEIFAQVHQLRPELVLVIAGSPALSRKYEQQIQQLIQKRGLGSRVLFTGQVNNGRALAQLFEQAKFLLVTSEWESFCVPLVEAMHFGVPPVVHQIDPLPEVSGAAAVVVDKHQPQQVAQKIVALLDDAAAYGTLQTAARKRAQHFTDVSLEQALVTLFKEGIWRK